MLCKYTNSPLTNYSLQNNELVREEIKKKYFKFWELTIKIPGHIESSLVRESYSIKCLHKNFLKAGNTKVN